MTNCKFAYCTWSVEIFFTGIMGSTISPVSKCFWIPWLKGLIQWRRLCMMLVIQNFRPICGDMLQVSS